MKIILENDRYKYFVRNVKVDNNAGILIRNDGYWSVVAGDFNSKDGKTFLNALRILVKHFTGLDLPDDFRVNSETEGVFDFDKGKNVKKIVSEEKVEIPKLKKTVAVRHYEISEEVFILEI